MRVKGLNMIINIVALIILIILIIIGIKNDVNNKNDICDDDIKSFHLFAGWNLSMASRRS